MITLGEIEARIENGKFDPALKLKLAVDAYRLHLKHIFDPASVVAVGKIDPLPHQIEAFVKMMDMLRPRSGLESRLRILIADDVGLGKTIIVGLVMKELLLRNRIRRILIVCPAGLQIQWEEEIKEKFEEEFEIIRGRIEGNPFKEKEKVIISMDYGRKEEKLEILRDSKWDLIVIDEAHKLRPETLRYNLGKLLSERTQHMILVTATPHDGKIENFLALLKLIDNRFEPKEDVYELKRYLEPMMIRRLKEEITDFEGNRIFPSRAKPVTVDVTYTEEEKEFYDAVGDYVNRYYRKAEERKKTTAILALYILHRRVASSLHAGVESLKKRKKRILEPYVDFEVGYAEEDFFDALDQSNDEAREKAEEILLAATASLGDEIKEELRELDELIEMGEKLVKEGRDSKSRRLLELFRVIKKERSEDKIIVFTEFKDTLSYLKKLLEEEGFIIAQIHGGMDIIEKEQQRDLFRERADILLGTEAAGEGLNLQFANIVINYELPWNPNRLEQRIGRVYRYGQEKKVYVYNYKTAFPIDNKVLDKLLEKIEEIRAIFGDRAVDVVGALISESEIMELFKISRIMSDAEAVEKVEELLDRKLNLLKEIEDFLVSERFDLSEISSLSRDMTERVGEFDIERFLLSYLSLGEYGDYAPKGDGTYAIYMKPATRLKDISCAGTLPRYEDKFYEFIGTFDRKAKKKGSFIALGNPALESALRTTMGFEPVALLKGEEEGVIFPYILRFFDGLENEIYAEPILIYKTESGIEVFNAIRIWDFASLNDNHSYNGNISVSLSGVPTEDDIATAIKDIEGYVNGKHQRDIELERKLITAEFDWRIIIENEKIKDAKAKGQNYLVPALSDKIKELRKEYQQLSNNLERARSISWKLCGPIGCGIVLKPKDLDGEEKGDPELRRAVELAGMRFVMEYERKNGRHPEDVSARFLGYDILSTSQEAKRLIEVKSFKAEGEIEMSSNEWRVASENRDNYYLYVVNYALSEPKLIIVQDPYNKLKDIARIVPLQDFKVIIPKLGS